MPIRKIFDILDLYKGKHSDLKDAFRYKSNNSWIEVSSENYYQLSYDFACGLIKKGFKKGDKIITISNSLPHWNIADMGIALTGLVHIPIYTTLGNEETEYIIRHSEAKIIIVSDEKLYKKIKPIADNIPDIEMIYTFLQVKDVPNWSEFMQFEDGEKDLLKVRLEEVKSSINEEDLFTIVYTSGATGNPKGVMLSHKNLISNIKSLLPILPVNYKDRVLSFLPFSHIYERTLLYSFQTKGCRIAYAENLGTIIKDLQDIKPHQINAVPRLLESFYDKIIAKGKDLNGISKILFFWAIRLGYKYNDRGNNSFWYRFKLEIARKLIFNKWKPVFGGELRAIVSGGASLQTRLAKLFTAAGFRVCEGYGLSETSPVIAVNWTTWDKQKLGTVGPILDSIEVKIAEDGEILVKGPTVMMGYYKDSATTDLVINEGWFSTGDVGEFVEDRFLVITDRKKEIFKLSAGKYVAPQVIENKFKSSSHIEQLMIIGENEKFVSALISPNFNYLHYFASKHKISYRDNKELIQNPEVTKKIQKEVDIVNASLGEHERIKRFRLVSEEWTTSSGELSPTLKLRRNKIKSKYSEIIDEIYNTNGKEKPNGPENNIFKPMKKLINIVGNDK